VVERTPYKCLAIGPIPIWSTNLSVAQLADATDLNSVQLSVQVRPERPIKKDGVTMKVFIVLEIDVLDAPQGKIVAIHENKDNADYTAKLLGSLPGQSKRYSYKVEKFKVQK
jgi:hypothetical protein